MPLNKYQQMSYKTFGPFAEKHASERLSKNLQAAHEDIRPGAFIAAAIMNGLIALIVSAVVLTILSLFILPVLSITLGIGMQIAIILICLPVALATYGLMMTIPGSKAKARQKDIDRNLAYAVNFISAMASAGATPSEIFKSLSKQTIYGEVQSEAAWIYRDVALLGSDIITAIKTNIDRTPSEHFKEFLQGMVVTITSGGSLKTYFMSKADQYMRENHQRQREMLETLGVMAESYVTAAVAGVLLMLIVIPLMMIISNDWNAMFLYILILILVPLIHTAFTYVIKLISTEGA